MSRLRVLAVCVLAAIAAIAGFVALVLAPAGSGAGSGAAATGGVPTPTATPSDLTAGVVVPAGVTVSTGRLEQDGVSRTWLLLAPTTLPAGVPLVVGLHGRNATPAEEAARDELLPYVAAGQAILVYPVGYDQAWNAGDGCCGLAVAAGIDDVAFVGDVVDAVRSGLGLTGPTDLVGYSNGGRLAFDISCHDAARYAAVVAVSAAPPTTPCPDEDVVRPLFAAVVGDDPELPTDDDPQPVAGVLAGIATQWTARDGCAGAPVVASAGEVTVSTWPTCADGSVVQTAVWPHGGHIWPKQDDVGSPDAADLVWSFLAGVQARATG